MERNNSNTFKAALQINQDNRNDNSNLRTDKVKLNLYLNSINTFQTEVQLIIRVKEMKRNQSKLAFDYILLVKHFNS